MVTRVSFGQLIAVGSADTYPTGVPTHYVFEADDRVLLHLARPKPIWGRIAQNPRVVLTLVADYVYAGWCSPSSRWRRR